MPFGLLKVRGFLKAKSPIFHGGDEKTGSVVLLRRMKFIVDEEPTDVPYISGNAVRGVWRRLIFKDMLEKIGYEIVRNLIEYKYPGKIYSRYAGACVSYFDNH